MKRLLSIIFAFSLPLSALGEQTCNPNMPRIAPSSRYLLRDGGQSVLDRATGLIWLRCPLGTPWDGSGCDDTYFPMAYEWQEALQAAHNFNGGGHEDWRLPNHRELMSLLETACNSPMLNETAFPGDKGRLTWSSTPNTATAGEAWALDTSGNRVHPMSKSSQITEPYIVRLVRGAP